MVHVTAVWRAPDGSLVTLRVGPDAPRSDADAFVLALARAHADAVVTTGRILRAEPSLRHALDARLLAWRRAALGRPEPPRSVVLSRGAALDLGHPFFRSASRPLLVTGREAAARLAGAAVRAAVEVVARDAPGLRDTLELLRRERGCRTVVVEAGPSSTAALYDEPVAVDELWLSLYEGPPPAARARGGALLPLSRLEAIFGPPRREEVRDEPSGRWRFRLYRRA